MRKTRKTCTERLAISEVKKQKTYPLAQRKFASAYPSSPSQKEVETLPKRPPPKAEDFIEFLCVRHAPFMSPELEVFTKPLVTSHSNSDDELFEDDKFENASQNENKLHMDLAFNPKVILNNIATHKNKSEIIQTVKECDTTMINVTIQHPGCEELKDFFSLVFKLAQSHEMAYLISPPNDWKTSSFIQDDLKFYVKTKHVHRLQVSSSESFIALHCIKKQLENDSVTKFSAIPQLGLCEMDLPLLLETVKMFGGVDAVNSDQNWKLVADHISIPKTASRRVSRLEDIYLKYILPYDLLPDKEKDDIRQLVEANLDILSKTPYESVSDKQVSLVTFHRMACNCQTMYWKQNASVEETEKQFWEFVSKGSRHVAAVSGEIDLAANPQSFRPTKSKGFLCLQDIYMKPESAFKCMGKIPRVSVPVLYVESVFWTSDWRKEKHGFHMLSYMHSGADKIWYIIAEESKPLFEEITVGKSRLNNPKTFIAAGCNVARFVQTEGQYVVIKPGCYYCTISTGYSCSETVSFASHHWFASPFFLSYKPSLKEHVVTKMTLNNAVEEVKKCQCPHYENFIPKLQEMCSLLEGHLQTFSTKGVKEVSCLKGKSAVLRTCRFCGEECFLLSARVHKNDDCLCVKHALEMLERKKLQAVDVSLEVVFTVDGLKNLVRKLQDKPGSKRKKKI